MKFCASKNYTLSIDLTAILLVYYLKYNITTTIPDDFFHLGVLLLASDQDVANRLNKLFLDHQIKKTYMAITKGIPNPMEGIAFL